MKSTPQKDKEDTVLRRRMFDRRRYKHIGYCICDDPDVELEITTAKGIRKLLDCCMLLPHMQYDRRRGAFLLADIFDVNRNAFILEVTTYERYDTGFAENMEYYELLPSETIFAQIDSAVDREWSGLLDRIEQSGASQKNGHETSTLYTD